MLNVPNEEYLYLKSLWNSLQGFVTRKQSVFLQEQ